jgi:hypothetical protein
MIAIDMEDLAQLLIEEGTPLPTPVLEASAPDGELIAGYGEGSGHAIYLNPANAQKAPLPRARGRSTTALRERSQAQLDGARIR